MTIVVDVPIPAPGRVEDIPTQALVSVFDIVTAGPQGPPGPQGEPGISGAGASFFLYDQATPATTWTIQHNMGYYPSVTVVDSAGTAWEGDVHYIDLNSLTVTFGAPFAGQASLS